MRKTLKAGLLCLGVMVGLIFGQELRAERLLTDAQLKKIKEMHKLDDWAYGIVGEYTILKTRYKTFRPTFYIVKTINLDKILKENSCELRFFKGQKLPEETDSSFEEDKFDCYDELYDELQHYHTDPDTGHVNKVHFPKNKNEKFYKGADLNEKGETIFYIYSYYNEKNKEVRREYDFGVKGVFKGLITEKIYYDPTKQSGDNLCITLREEDTNENGIFDEWEIYENCKEVRREYDDIENGTKKQITEKIHYDPTKRSGDNLCITLVEEDTNKNGIFDEWTIYENCKEVRREYDENENGTKETINYYKNGELHSQFKIGAKNKEKAEASVEQAKFAEAITFYQAANKELIQEWGSNTKKVCNNLTGIANALYDLKSVELIAHAQALLAKAECSLEHEQAALLLGWYYIEKEDYDAALKVLEPGREKYLKEYKEISTDIHRALGRAFYMKKEYQKVIAILEPAIQIYKKTHTKYCTNEKDCNYLDFTSYVDYLNSYEKLKNFSKVHDIARETEPLLKQMPADARAQFALLVGYGYLLNKNIAKATTYTKLSLDAKFFYSGQYFHHALALLMSGKQKEAEAFFGKAKQGDLKVEDMLETFELLKTIYPNQSKIIEAAKQAHAKENLIKFVPTSYEKLEPYVKLLKDKQVNIKEVEADFKFNDSIDGIPGRGTSKIEDALYTILVFGENKTAVMDGLYYFERCILFNEAKGSSYLKGYMTLSNTAREAFKVSDDEIINISVSAHFDHFKENNEYGQKLVAGGREDIVATVAKAYVTSEKKDKPEIKNSSPGELSKSLLLCEPFQSTITNLNQSMQSCVEKRYLYELIMATSSLQKLCKEYWKKPIMQCF